MLFWWHAIGAGPRIHRKMPPLARAGYVLSAVPPNMIAGIAIAFAGQTVYTYYEAMPRLLGLSVLDDQRIGGVIMWLPGSMMYMVAALALVSRWLQQEERKRPLLLSRWATDDYLIAPGWKK
jgi:putative membrane protein